MIQNNYRIFKALFYKAGKVSGRRVWNWHEGFVPWVGYEMLEILTSKFWKRWLDVLYSEFVKSEKNSRNDGEAE